MKKLILGLMSLFLSFSALAEEFHGKILRLVPDDEGIKVITRGTGFDSRILSIYLLQDQAQFKNLDDLFHQALKDKSTVVFDIKKDTLILIQNAHVQK